MKKIFIIANIIAVLIIAIIGICLYPYHPWMGVAQHIGVTLVGSLLWFVGGNGFLLVAYGITHMDGETRI